MSNEARSNDGVVGSGDGARSSGTVGGLERFFVGDRDVGASVGAASLAATQMSAGTFVGTVGIHYAVGISFFAVWPAIWLGWLVSMLYVAPQLRRFEGVTVPEFVADRFDDDGADGRRSRALVASVVVLIYLVYTTAQYVAGGVVLHSLFGLSHVQGVLLIVGVTVAYTTVGGMEASILSDALQMVLMVVGLGVAVVVGVVDVGGPLSLVDATRQVDPTLLGWGMSPERIAGFALAFGLGMTVAPYEISRVYAMKDAGTVNSAIRRSIVIQAFVAVCVAVLGLLARVTYPALPNPDAALAELALSTLGPVAGGLLLLAVLAAILSTVDSILLVSSSAVAYDLYAGVIRHESGNEPVELAGDETAVARAATVLAAVVPLGFALRPDVLGGLVQLIVALYAALIAGALFAPILLGLHWRGATTVGSLAGVLTGATAVVVWHLFATATTIGALSAIPSVVVGVTVSTATIVLASAVERVVETERFPLDA